MKSESNVKRYMVNSMKEHGGYARRIEDQYAVGLFDMILIPVGMPVFMAEVKVFDHDTFGPTPRQAVELHRISEVAQDAGHVIPVMIGYKNDVFYFHKPQSKIHRTECFSVTTTEAPFYRQLVLYYYSIKGLR
jgi:hypothetical protein